MSIFGNNLDHSLLCPNQLRHNGITVNDAPQQFVPTSRHAIIVPNGALSVTISLTLCGIFLGFDIVKPTNDNIVSLPQLHLTSDVPWDPYLDEFKHNKDAVSLDYSPAIASVLSITCCNADFDLLIEKS